MVSFVILIALNIVTMHVPFVLPAHRSILAVLVPAYLNEQVPAWLRMEPVSFCGTIEKNS